MNALKLTGYVDDQHLLHLEVPGTVPPGPVEVVVTFPSTDEDDAGSAWMQGVAREWQAELGDDRNDLYTHADGKPIDGSR